MRKNIDKSDLFDGLLECGDMLEENSKENNSINYVQFCSSHYESSIKNKNKSPQNEINNQEYNQQSYIEPNNKEKSHRINH